MNKLSHKLIVLCVKYIPAILAIVEFVATLLVYFNIGIGGLSIIFGTSVLSLIPMYIASYAFNFCKYHRLILNYIALNKLLYIIDDLFKLPLADYNFMVFYIVLTGLFFAATIYNYLKYGDRSDS